LHRARDCGGPYSLHMAQSMMASRHKFVGAVARLYRQYSSPPDPCLACVARASAQTEAEEPPIFATFGINQLPRWVRAPEVAIANRASTRHVES
jgi:hypothetical protein